MEEIIAGHAGGVRQRIRSLVVDSERLFLKLADTFPAFVGEMKRSLDQSSASLSKLGAGSSFDESLRGLFASSRDAISGAASRFREMQQRDHELLSSLNNGIATLGSLDSIIARIKDDSVEMELISLNAMTVALKSGTAGKAFSVITEELKRLSSRTIALTDRLTEDGKKLLAAFESFRSDVELLEKQQGELFDGLENRLSGAFSTLDACVRETGSRMRVLVEGSRGIERPIRSIMETVQLQDIVKQSLDHVLMAIDEMDSASASAADDLVLRSRLAELAASMVADVRSQLSSASSVISEKTAEVASIVEDGEEKRRELLEESIGASGSGSALASFSAADAMLESLSGQVERYLKTKSALASSGYQLTAAVESLDRGFLEFSKILSRFKNIDVASRIEVAKQQALRSMSDTVVEMSELTTRIGADVADAMQATRGFISETKSAIASYASRAEEESRQVRASQESLAGVHRGLERHKDSLRESALGFSLFTKAFLSLLSDARRESGAFGRMLSELDSVFASFGELKDAADAELERMNKSADADSLDSPRFREVIERFTIYAHKQAAADIGGFAVESGGELGEVTLF